MLKNNFKNFQKRLEKFSKMYYYIVST